MSNTTVENQEEIVGFSSAKVAKLPTLACIGHVSEASEAKTTKDGEGLYDMVKVTIQGDMGSRNTNVNFLFRPEWFRPGFDAETIKEYTDVDPATGKVIGESMYFVYRNNIQAQGSKLSVLKGLCGSEQNFLDFCKARNAAYKALVAANNGSNVIKDDEGNDVPLDFTSAEIRDLLANFLVSTGATVAYTLQQGRQKTSDLDESGKPVYELTDRYELGQLSFYDEALLKYWNSRAAGDAKRAERAGTKPTFRLAFEQ